MGDAADGLLHGADLVGRALLCFHRLPRADACRAGLVERGDDGRLLAGAPLQRVRRAAHRALGRPPWHSLADDARLVCRRAAGARLGVGAQSATLLLHLGWHGHRHGRGALRSRLRAGGDVVSTPPFAGADALDPYRWLRQRDLCAIGPATGPAAGMARGARHAGGGAGAHDGSSARARLAAASGRFRLVSRRSGASSDGARRL